jgi:hypothetical protein
MKISVLNRAEKNEVQTIQDFQIAWVFWAEKTNSEIAETALSYVSKLSSDAKWKDTTRLSMRWIFNPSRKKLNHKELYDVLSLCEL